MLLEGGLASLFPSRIHLLNPAMSDNLIQLSQHSPVSPKTKTSKDQQQQQQKQKQHGPSPLSKVIKYASNTVLSWRDGLSESEREQKREREERMDILAARMQNVGIRSSLVFFVSVAGC